VGIYPRKSLLLKGITSAKHNRWGSSQIIVRGLGQIRRQEFCHRGVSIGHNSFIVRPALRIGKSDTAVGALVVLPFDIALYT
jgi:hypothetical protein